MNTPLAEDEDNEATEIDLSICGHLITDPNITGGEQILKAFEENKVTFDKFVENPHQILQNPKLVVRIED